MSRLLRRYYELLMSQIEAAEQEADKHHCYGVGKIIHNLKDTAESLFETMIENEEEDRHS